MAERIIPSGNTLIKYNNPVLVTKHVEKFSMTKVMSALKREIFDCCNKLCLLGFASVCDSSKSNICSPRSRNKKRDRGNIKYHSSAERMGGRRSEMEAGGVNNASHKIRCRKSSGTVGYAFATKTSKHLLVFSFLIVQI